MKIVIGITGASGGIYAERLLDELIKRGFEIHGVFSRTGEEVLRFERNRSRHDFPGVIWHETDDFFSLIASGSNPADGMVVVPCSMNTAACIAHGISTNLLQRAAAVTLKERRPLIVVPRETPLDTIHLETLLMLARAGATVLPAMPAFYHHPDSIEDLVRPLTGKILSLLGIPNELLPKWRPTSAPFG